MLHINIVSILKEQTLLLLIPNHVLDNSTHLSLIVLTHKQLLFHFA